MPVMAGSGLVLERTAARTRPLPGSGRSERAARMLSLRERRERRRAGSAGASSSGTTSRTRATSTAGLGGGCCEERMARRERCLVRREGVAFGVTFGVAGRVVGRGGVGADGRDEVTGEGGGGDWEGEGRDGVTDGGSERRRRLMGVGVDGVAGEAAVMERMERFALRDERRAEAAFSAATASSPVNSKGRGAGEEGRGVDLLLWRLRVLRRGIARWRKE